MNALARLEALLGQLEAEGYRDVRKGLGLDVSTSSACYREGRLGENKELLMMIKKQGEEESKDLTRKSPLSDQLGDGNHEKHKEAAVRSMPELIEVPDDSGDEVQVPGNVKVLTTQQHNVRDAPSSRSIKNEPESDFKLASITKTLDERNGLGKDGDTDDEDMISPPHKVTLLD